MVKKPSASTGDAVQSLIWEDPTHLGASKVVATTAELVLRSRELSY